MATWAVLATGQSLTPEQVEAVRGLPVVAVSDAYRRAPWAAAMASQDRKWWDANPDALQFAGRKFTTRQIAGVERVPVGSLSTSANSGLLGVHVARLLGATRVLLLGVDLRGTHYFGPHTAAAPRHGRGPEPLRNTTASRFETFKKQFARYPRGELEIINCSPGSALTCFPRAKLEDVL